MMGRKDSNSEVDTLTFKTFPSDDFVGFYAALDVDGTYIKTLGALADTCAIDVAAENILGQLGQGRNPFEPISSKPSSEYTFDTVDTTNIASPLENQAIEEVVEEATYVNPKKPNRDPDWYANRDQEEQESKVDEVVQKLNDTIAAIQEIENSDGFNGNLNVTSVIEAVTASLS